MTDSSKSIVNLIKCIDWMATNFYWRIGSTFLGLGIGFIIFSSLGMSAISWIMALLICVSITCSAPIFATIRLDELRKKGLL